MLTAIIVAGGSSVRAGFDKTFAILGEKPVILHSIEAFQHCEVVDGIIVVGREDRLSELRELIGKSSSKITDIIPGGVRRQDSVLAGLNQLNAATTYIAVHDAARPLVTPELIGRVFALAREHGAAAAASSVVDTLKRGTSDGVVCGSVDREELYAMQTPQIFERDLLESAYAATKADGVAITDEVSAIERKGGKVVLAPNDDFNFKITFASDLALAEFVLQRRRTLGTR